MKLSTNTIQVLKNFASINQNLVIKEGSEIKTISAIKNIVAKCPPILVDSNEGLRFFRCSLLLTDIAKEIYSESIVFENK